MLKMVTFIGAKRGYVLVSLALVGAVLGAGLDLSGFGHSDW